MFPRRTTITFLLAALAVSAIVMCAPGLPASAGEAEQAAAVGIDEKLGAVIPEGLVFKDENGKEVDLRGIMVRPTILTLVYLRCPNICSPLMEALAKVVDAVPKFVPGKDYDLITVSFDPREGPEMAKRGQARFLDRMKTKVAPEAWRFLTGDQENITRLTSLVGFRYMKDKQDFKHASTVIFLTKDGKIVRYFGGLEAYSRAKGDDFLMHPFELEMAINDATTGTERTVIQRIQQLCFAYDPESKTYTLMINRIILFVTLLGVGIFVMFLVIKRKRTKVPPKESPPDHTSIAGDAMEGGAV